MRSEHFTVGLVADGTDKLEGLPVTKQDPDATEVAQICANCVEGGGRWRSGRAVAGWWTVTRKGRGRAADSGADGSWAGRTRGETAH
jgi:hypothetical protein